MENIYLNIWYLSRSTHIALDITMFISDTNCVKFEIVYIFCFINSASDSFDSFWSGYGCRYYCYSWVEFESNRTTIVPPAHHNYEITLSRSRHAKQRGRNIQASGPPAKLVISPRALQKSPLGYHLCIARYIA